MKKLLFLSLLFLSLSTFAQTEITQEQADSIYNSIPVVDSVIQYTEVVNVDATIKKAELYSNLKSFFIHEFKSANAVIQYDEKNEGKVIGKGNFSFATAAKYFVSTYYINFTLEVQVKDGKYRYKIDNFDNNVQIGDKLLPISIKSMHHLTTHATFEDAKAGFRKALYLLTNGVQGIIYDLKKAMVKKDDF